jgi:hypothetical protein
VVRPTPFKRGSLYPERGIAFSYGRISGKRLNVVMTFATRWRMFKV